MSSPVAVVEYVYLKLPAIVIVTLKSQVWAANFTPTCISSGQCLPFYAFHARGDFLLSATILCKQFAIGLGPTECRSQSRSKPFDMLMLSNLSSAAVLLGFFRVNLDPATSFCHENVVCFFTSAAYIQMHFRLDFFMEANNEYEP